MYNEKDDIEFDSVFREKLGNESMQPSPMAWEKIEKRLDEKSKKRPGAWIWFTGGALVLATLCIIFYPVVFKNKTTNTNSLSVNTTKANAENENKNATSDLNSQNKTSDNTTNTNSAEQKNNNSTENKNELTVDEKKIIEKNNSGTAISEYRIQLGIFKKKRDLEKFQGLTNVSEVQDSAGRYHYYAGPFSSLEKAKEGSVNVLRAGYDDAFIVGFTDGKNVYLPDEMQVAINSAARNSNSKKKNEKISAENNKPDKIAAIKKTSKSNANDSANKNKNPDVIALTKNPDEKKTGKKNPDKVKPLNQDSIRLLALNEKIKNEQRINDSLKLAEQTRKKAQLDSLNRVQEMARNKQIADSARIARAMDSAVAVADSLLRAQKANDSLAALTPKRDTTKPKSPAFDIEKNWIAFNVGYNQVMNNSNNTVNGVSISSETGKPSWVAGVNYGRHLWKGLFVNASVSATQNTYRKEPEMVKFYKYINDYYYLPTSVANIPIYKDTMLNGFFFPIPIDSFGAKFGYTQKFSYVEGAINTGYTFKAGRFRFPVYAGYNFSFLVKQKTSLEIVKENFTQHFEYSDVLKKRNYSAFILSLACEVRVFRRGYLFVEGRMKYSSSNISTTPGVNYKPFTIQVPVGYKIYF